MITILIGISSSVVAELVTWLNKQLSGTVFKGDAAFILAALVAFIGALVKVYLVPVPAFQEFLTQFAGVWAVSQGFILLVVQMFGLDVQPSQTS